MLYILIFLLHSSLVSDDNTFSRSAAFQLHEASITPALNYTTYYGNNCTQYLFHIVMIQVAFSECLFLLSSIWRRVSERPSHGALGMGGWRLRQRRRHGPVRVEPKAGDVT